MPIKSLTENTGTSNILKFFSPFHLPSENILAKGGLLINPSNCKEYTIRAPVLFTALQERVKLWVTLENFFKC